MPPARQDSMRSRFVLPTTGLAAALVTLASWGHTQSSPAPSGANDAVTSGATSSPTPSADAAPTSGPVGSPSSSAEASRVPPPDLRSLEPSPAASQAPGGPAATASSEPAHDEGLTIHLGLPGEWQIRGVTLSEQRLSPTPGQSSPTTLGQRGYLEQWFRFSPEVSFGERLKLVGQFDVLRGIIVGDSTQQVELSRDNRDTTFSPFPHGVFDLRWIYLEWTAPIGLIRVGMQGSHWGLGIVANDGNHRPVFGDYRLGDVVFRAAFATRPLGRYGDLVLALAGDLVYRDQFASLLQNQVPAYDGNTPMRPAARTLGDDRVWQGILSLFWQDHTCRVDCERKRIGVYGVYRDWTNPSRPGDYLRAVVGDFYGRWEWPTPDGRARVFAALELVGILGVTNFARNVDFSQQDLIQFGAASEMGIERDDRYRITLAAGYASGDSNPNDGAQRRMTFNPDYHIGLIMFPELLAWQTARSASIAVDNRLLGMPTRGADLIPTSGGVANAAYFNPTAIINFSRWIDIRAGVVLGVSTSDVVDPVSVTVYGGPRNYRGGDSRARDLGIEFDLGLMGRYPLAPGLYINGGAQGGVMLPGHAFYDAAGEPLGLLWTARAIAGLQYY